MNAKKGHVSSNQEGFAALVIALVLVLVLSLLTVGFAELMRKEQRSALDKHLSTQAYYAAESGINDAVKAINAGYSQTKTNCGVNTGDTSTGSEFLRNTKVGTDDASVSYTCLLIDPTPPTLEYGSSDETQSKVVQLTGVNSSDPTQLVRIVKVNISWQDADGGTTFAGAGQTFPPVANWTSNTGVMRIGLLPLGSGAVDRGTMQANFYQAFLYPNAGANAQTGVTSYGSDNYANGVGDSGGRILSGQCNSGSRPRFCNTTINLTSPGSTNVLLTMRWVYKPSRVTITAFDSNNNQLRIKNAQILVDSTGKAQDVLRRVQVRVPARNTFDHTDYALEVMNGICKQIDVLPNSATRQCNP